MPITERKPITNTEAGEFLFRKGIGKNPITGKYEQASKIYRTKSKRDLARAYSEWVTTLEKNKGEIFASHITVAKAVEEWLEDISQPWRRGTSEEYSPTTLRGYKRLAELVMSELGHIELANLRARHLDDWYLKLKQPPRSLSVQSVRRIHAVISGVLKRAVIREYVATNVARDASPGKQESKPVDRNKVPLTDEVHRLFRLIEKSKRPEFAALVRVAAYTGLRRGELCALRWSDIDFARGRLTVDESIYQLSGSVLGVKGPKGKQHRTISIGATVMDVLRQHRERMDERCTALETKLAKNAFVFSDDDGSTPWKPDSVTQAFARFREKAGLPKVVLHGLRHFHGSEMVDAGESLATVQERLGHADQIITAKFYIHGKEASDQKAANRFEELMNKRSEVDDDE